MGNKMRNKVKTIEDLQKIYYGPNKDGKNVSVDEIKRYEDCMRTRHLSLCREREVKQFFSPIGELKKIPRCHDKTSDFKIEKEKLLIEVTSINTAVTGKQDEDIGTNLPTNENEFIAKINRKIRHAEEKKDYGEYYRIVTIYCDAVIVGLGNAFIKKLYDSEFIRKTTFLTSSVDALIFLPTGIGGNIETPKPICYVKEPDLVDLLTKLEKLELKLLRD